MERRLMRSRRHRMIAGVCGGIAEYLHADPSVVRLLWVLLSIFPGSVLLGVLAYVAAWIILPEAPA